MEKGTAKGEEVGGKGKAGKRRQRNREGERDTGIKHEQRQKGQGMKRKVHGKQEVKGVGRQGY